MRGHVDLRFVGRRWGERPSTGLDLIRDTSEKVDLIQKCLLIAQSRQKSCADKRQRPLESEVGDPFFFKVMPMREVVRFGKQGNLSPRYIDPLRYLRGWVQLRIGWLCRQVYRVFIRCSMSPFSGSTLQIQLM